MALDSRSIQLFFFDAGGGHRAAAEALKSILGQQHPEWEVEVVNLQEILKSSDPLYILTGVASQDYYNAALKMGLTYGSRAFLRGMQSVIKLCAPRMEESLREYWQARNGKKLDAVISVVPNFNAVMYRALRAELPTVPFITIMTDMADSPPHFWQEKQDQYLVCGTEYAAQQARATGWYRPERIFKTSGMILRPAFYQLPDKPRMTRTDLGLDENKTTAIIMFGGYGSFDAKIIVDKLAKAELDIQTIVICGKNEELFASLQGKENCHVVGFTKDIADYMRLADFFIGKPGPGSISEAWHMGLPVIVERDASTMIQERPNVTVIEQTGTGIAVKDFRSIARTIEELIESGRFETMRDNVRKIHNRAIFEIPDMLDHIMKQPATTAKIIELKPTRKFGRRIARRLAQLRTVRSPR